MIPDVLISKYLDGELSLEEDIEFRAMLGADPEARDAFDSAVLLHIAMRCEDDTVVPADVEDRVLAFIDNAPLFAREYNTLPPTSAALGKGLKARGNASRRMMAVAALLLLIALPLGDQLFRLDTLIGDNATSVTRPIADVQTDNTPNGVVLREGGSIAHKKTRANEMTLGPTVAAEPVLAKGPTVAAEPVLAKGPTVAAEPVLAKGPTVVPTLHSLFSSKDIPVVADARGQEPKASLISVDAPSIEVLVSTSFSQSFTSPTAGVVTTVAAGIGYAVSTNTFVGMEMGSTQYTRTNETSGLVPDNTSAATADARRHASKQQDASGQLAKVTVESNTSPRYRTEIHTSVSPEGTVWGAAFVQHSILKTGMLALNGRVGAGVGEDGMLSYGRMQAEYVVFSGVSLTIGAEARYSPFRTGVVGGQTMARTYGTVISALYGLQVRL